MNQLGSESPHASPSSAPKRGEGSAVSIAVDAMGGDHGPEVLVEGALTAARERQIKIILVGQAEEIQSHLKANQHSQVDVVDAADVVGMHEPAVTPVRRKPESSVRVAAELVRAGKADGLVTAGHTGAAMITAKVVIGMVPGVDRPALATVFPNRAHGRTVLLDVGANVDVKPAQLREFAIMGHVYAQELLGLADPRVGLLAIGEEESKGNHRHRQGYEVLQNTGLNFTGNVEGHAVFDGSVDVVVCDGFVGNAILKAAESIAETIGGMLREEFEVGWRTKAGFAIARPAVRRMRERLDYRRYGGAPFLGVRGACFVAHGRSNATAIHNTVLQAAEFCRGDIAGRMERGIAALHREEDRMAEQGERLAVSGRGGNEE